MPERRKISHYSLKLQGNDEAASIVNSFKEKTMNNAHAVEVESEQELFGTIDTSDAIQLSLSDLDLVAGGTIVNVFG